MRSSWLLAPTVLPASCVSSPSIRPTRSKSLASSVPTLRATSSQQQRRRLAQRPIAPRPAATLQPAALLLPPPLSAVNWSRKCRCPLAAHQSSLPRKVCPSSPRRSVTFEVKPAMMVIQFFACMEGKSNFSLGTQEIGFAPWPPAPPPAQSGCELRPALFRAPSSD